MNNYKRLTRKDIKLDKKQFVGTNYGKGVSYEFNEEALDNLVKVFNRLAEYEDDEESGKIVRLPCKVGDTVYFVWEEYTNGKQKLSIEEWEVEKICIEKNEWSVKGLGEELVEGVRQFFWCHSSKFGIWWFLTREEAEKKLKELQNG